MTVIIKRLDCKGQIITYEHVKGIIDNDSNYELFINKNWSVICSKKNHRIINVED